MLIRMACLTYILSSDSNNISSDDHFFTSALPGHNFFVLAVVQFVFNAVFLLTNSH